MFLEQFWKQRSNNNNIVKILLCFTVLLVSIDFGPRFWSNNNNNRNQGGAGQIQLVNALQQPQQQQQQQGPAKFTSNNNNNNNVDQNKNQTDSICQKMTSTNAQSRLRILTVGLFPNRMMLITESLYIYELKRNSVNDAIAKLYINGTKPEPMQTKWPALYRDRRFQAIQGKIFNSFTVYDSSGDYVLFTIKSKRYPSLDGVTYHIQKQKVYLGLRYNEDDDQVLLSTDIPLTFYALSKPNGINLAIATYKFANNRIASDTGGIEINAVNQFSLICQRTGPNQIPEIYMASHGRCQGAKWPILKGFISAGKFYLFGDDFIVTFDQTVYTSPGEKVNVNRQAYDGFINCGYDIPAPKTHNSSLIGIILAIVLLLLLFILFVILFLRRKKEKDSKAKKDKHHHRTSQKGTTLAQHVKSGQQDPATMSRSMSKNIINNGPQSSTTGYGAGGAGADSEAYGGSNNVCTGRSQLSLSRTKDFKDQPPPRTLSGSAFYHSSAVPSQAAFNKDGQQSSFNNNTSSINPSKLVMAARSQVMGQSAITANSQMFTGRSGMSGVAQLPQQQTSNVATSNVGAGSMSRANSKMTVSQAITGRSGCSNAGQFN